MKKPIISRREFLKKAGVSAAALAVGGGLIDLLAGCTTSHVDKMQPADNATAAAIAFVPDVEIALRAVPTEVSILPGALTRVWRYEAEIITGGEDVVRTLPDRYVGPIFRVHQGQRVRVHFTNDLPEESVVHWHGLHVPDSADGHPRLAIAPGETYIYEFQVLNRAGTYWFHPHPHERTGAQVFAGLAGLFLVSDDEEQALGLPSGEYDLPLVIQDRTLNADNQLVYDTGGMMGASQGFLGNRILINGQTSYVLSAAARSYRLRLLNGSNSRIYKLAWEDGTPLTVIGTDGGLLEQPIERNSITLAPAQRIELWVDFSQWAGGSVRLVNLPFDAVGGENSFAILTANVAKEAQDFDPLPEFFGGIARYDPKEAVNAAFPRNFELAMGMGMRWTINGRTFEMTETARDEVVERDTLEVWQFENKSGSGMGMMRGMDFPHPMHVHGLQFQIVERDVKPGFLQSWQTLSEGFVDEGWHDTVLVLPGEQVKTALRFEDFTGLYMLHCHNLEHEDMGMMRNYRIA